MARSAISLFPLHPDAPHVPGGDRVASQSAFQSFSLGTAVQQSGFRSLHASPASSLSTAITVLLPAAAM